jgi:hypothetical protein
MSGSRATLLRFVAALGLLAGLHACSPPQQPGCTAANTRAMVDACRVEFSGVSSRCFTNTRSPAGTDYSPWWVEACNLTPGGGKTAECIAGKSGECHAARDAGLSTDAVVSSCADPTLKLPEKACDDQCTATRTACDDQCSGGRPCDLCMRMGGSCGDVCPATSFKACADCSMKCARSYFACSERCPRQ